MSLKEFFVKIYEYDSYEEYVEEQSNGAYIHPNVPDSINYEWVQKSEIQFLWKEVIKPYFYGLDIMPIFGICHGVKLGKENMWFQNETGIDFIGTDISTETNHEMKLLNWDFHKVKDEWINKFDVMYTNSLDHSYDPNYALSQWMSCLTKNGIGIVEHTDGHTDSTSIDPFGATKDEYIELIIANNGNLILETHFTSNRDKTYLVFTRNNNYYE